MVARTIDTDVTAGRSRISWGAVFAATVVSLAVWLLLYAVGLAVGLTAVDPTESGSLRAVGIGTGIWSVLAPLIALFVGGWVASRESTVLQRMDAALHGVVVWALSALLGVVLLGSLVTSLIGGAAGLVGDTAAAAGRAAGQADAEGIMQTLGLSSNDLLAPINERLEAQGRPPVEAAGVEAALRDAVGQAVRTGELSRQDLVSALASNTALSQEDAQAVAAQVEQQWQQRSSELAQAAQGAAAQAADVTAGTLWALAASLFLSLVAAVLGAVVGLSRRQRRVEVVSQGPTPDLAPAH